MQRLHFGDGPARKQATDVNQFVGLRLREDALQAACARPLLHNERDGQSALNFRGSTRLNNSITAAAPKRSPIEAPAIFSPSKFINLRLMTIGSRTSTPALRTSASELAPISTYIFSMSLAFGGLVRPG